MSKIIFVTGVSGEMASGEALNDKDRAPWLKAINQTAFTESEKEGAVVSCSALKEKYRLDLAVNLKEVVWIHLGLEKENIADRLKKREGHFMPPELLNSQFEAYEQPTSGILIVNDADSDIIIDRILADISKL